MSGRQLAQIQLAMDVAKRNEDEAAMRLYNIKQKLIEEEQRLHTLLKYQQEYQEQAAAQSQAMPGNLYQNQQVFIKNIIDATTKQYQQVDKFKEIVDKQAQLWYALKARTRALETLISEIQHEVKQQEAKRYQQLQDELVHHKRIQRD